MASRLGVALRYGQVTRFAYDSDGRRTDTWWHTNTAHTTFAAHTHNDFDKSGRLVRNWTSRASSDTTRIFDSSYSYTKAGKDTGLVQSITDNMASTNNASTLSYDSQNRLTGASNWHGTNYTYTYDSVGNRKTMAANGTTTQSLTFNADNEITSSGYAYDKAGRRTADPTNGGNLTWNSAGQMTKEALGTHAATFMYAGQGQRELIQQTKDGSVTNYTYGRANQVGVAQMERFVQPGNTSTWDYDAAGQPIDYNQNNTDYYLVYDGLGQLISTMLPDGTQNGSNLTPDPWGNLNLGGGANAAAKSTPLGKVNATTSSAGRATPWTTVGIGNQTAGPATWWLRGDRWNDTGTGTWTSVDPITRLNDPNRANPYTYTGDDPINNIDPAGRFDFSWSDLGGTIGAGLGALALGGGVATLCVGTGGLGCAVAAGAAGAFGGGVGGGLGTAFTGGGEDDVYRNSILGAAGGALFATP